MEAAIQQLIAANEPVPKPLPLPTIADVAAAEGALGIKFPQSYVQLQLEAGNVVFGTLEPATLPPNTGHTYIVSMARNAWSVGVPLELLPICESNGDYFCLSPSGAVVFWSHNGVSQESWPNLKAWVLEVWLNS